MGGTVIDCGFVEVPYPFGFKEVFNPPKRSMGDPDVQLELEAPRTGQFFPFQPIAWFVYSLIQQTLRECGLAVTQGGRSSLKKTFFRSGRTRPHTYLPSKYLPSTYCVPCPGPNPGTPALNSIARSEVDTNSFIPLSRSSLPLRTRISLMQQCPCCLAKGLVHSFGFLNVFTKCSMSGLVVQVLGDLTVTKGGLVTVCEALAVCVLFLCGRGWQITQGGRDSWPVRLLAIILESPQTPGALLGTKKAYTGIPEDSESERPWFPSCFHPPLPIISVKGRNLPQPLLHSL